MVSEIAAKTVQAPSAVNKTIKPVVARQIPTSGDGKNLPMSEPDTVESPQRVHEVVSSVRTHIQNLQRTLEFSIDEESGRTVIRVLDRESRELIRQIPAEELLVIAKRLEAATGILIRDKA